MFYRDTVNNVAPWLGRAHELADGVEHLAQLKAGAGGEAVVSERKRLGLLLKRMGAR